ncbi:hypothetical protein D3C79_708900 [compost metagenome]
MNLKRVAASTDRTTGDIDLLTGTGQVCNGRGRRIFQRIRRASAGHRCFQCRAQLAEGFQHVLVLVSIGRDRKLVACLRRTGHLVGHPGHRQRRRRKGTFGDRLAVGRQRLGIELVSTRPRELDHRTITGERAAIGGLISHTTAGDLGAGGVAAISGGIERIRACFQRELAPAHGGVGIGTLLQGNGYFEFHPTQGNLVGTFGLAVEGTIGGRFRGDVITVGVSDGVLRRAGEGQLVGLACRETVVVGGA